MRQPAGNARARENIFKISKPAVHCDICFRELLFCGGILARILAKSAFYIALKAKADSNVCLLLLLPINETYHHVNIYIWPWPARGRHFSWYCVMRWH